MGSNCWLPKFIHAFQSAHPGLPVRLSMGNTETVAASLRQGGAHPGFVEGEVAGPSLTVTAVAGEDMAFLGGHPGRSEVNCTAKPGQIDLVDGHMRRCAPTQDSTSSRKSSGSGLETIGCLARVVGGASGCAGSGPHL